MADDDVVVPLGSGGWIPSPDRQTSCFLIRQGTRALVLDAGSGLGRLTVDPSWMDGVERVTIVLSHFHLDHISGLAMLNDRFCEERRVTIAGPGLALYGLPTSELISNLTTAPFQTRSPVAAARFADIGESLQPDVGFELTYRHQRLHPLPSVGIRLADSVTYCTDTEADPGTSDFASGTRLLLHEAWAPVAAERGHTSAVDAGRIASAADAGELALTHVDPRCDAESLRAAAAAVFPRVSVATDMRPIAIPN